MVSIRDWLGRLIPFREIMREVASSDDMGVRSPRSNHPANGMTPARLGQILRAADDGDSEAYYELAEDMEERDPHYLAVLGTRKRSVAQLPITVKPASDDADHKRHAELVQQWLDEDTLRAALFDILDAVGKGFSVTEIDWRFSDNLLLPATLTWRTPRWFTHDRTDGETLLMRDALGNLPLAPHKFVVHRHKAKSGLTVRSGIARVACWAWMFKSFTTRDWAIFVQNYGAPIRIGKYGQNATEKDKAVLWRAVSKIAGDAAAIIPDNMLLEFIETGNKASSADLFERRADWLDRQTSKVVLGQTTTTDAVSGGHAVAQEHRLVQEDIERADALLLSATLNDQLVPNIVAFNFGPQAKYPRLLIGRPDEIPIDVFATAFDRLAGHGLTAELAFVRDRMGIPTPKPGAELVGGRAPAPALPDPGAPTQGGQTARQAMDRLFGGSRHTAEPTDHVELIGARLDREAAGALGGMIEEVKAALEQATDLRDAAERLARLNLSSDALAEAMARGMALAHLAGQAAMIDTIKAAK